MDKAGIKLWITYYAPPPQGEVSREARRGGVRLANDVLNDALKVSKNITSGNTERPYPEAG